MEFVFSAPKRFRHILQATSGWVIVQADYVGQEAGILGEQAQDPAYLAAYSSGDIHLACAKLCKLVPENATTDTHWQERAQLKVVNLAIPYGGSVGRIAAQLGTDLATADNLVRTHKRVFHRVHDYLASCVDTADTFRKSITQDGWHKQIVAPFNPRSALNFGVQATGAAILRRAIVLAARAGLPLVAVVHDSLVMCCQEADARAVIEAAERVMVAAAAYFCPGIRLRVDFATDHPVPARSDLPVKRIADPGNRESYLRVLAQAKGEAEK